MAKRSTQIPPELLPPASPPAVPAVLGAPPVLDLTKMADMGDMPETPPEEEQGPEIIEEGDPEGRQPGLGTDPIDLPEHIKNPPTNETAAFPTFTSDAPMTLEDMEREVASRAPAVTDVARAPEPPKEPPKLVEEPPPPPKPAQQARIEEEQAAGRAIIARRQAEHERNRNVQRQAEADEAAKKAVEKK